MSLLETSDELVTDVVCTVLVWMTALGVVLVPLSVMWIEVDLQGVMRAIPARLLESRIQRVSDLEMSLIKSAVEATAP